MELLRTPDERFAHLGDFPYEPRYTEIEGIRIHHVDEGSGPVVLLLHGEPSWAYLYRKMIPHLVSAGSRVVVPDLVGFGRSDKPRRIEDHTYERHVEWMHGWMLANSLSDITLFGQDWGGLIGLRLVAADPDRFARVAVSNTGLPTGDQKMSDAFVSWQEFARNTESFPVGRIIDGGTVGTLSAEVVAAYDSPFPDESYKAGPRVMPSLVPTTPDDPSSGPNRGAWVVLQQWQKPFLTLFSDSDPITAGGERAFHRLVPGCRDQPHRTIEDAGHFVQEDKGEELASTLIDWMR